MNVNIALSPVLQRVTLLVLAREETACLLTWLQRWLRLHYKIDYRLFCFFITITIMSIASFCWREEIYIATKSQERLIPAFAFCIALLMQSLYEIKQNS